ncbi:MAG: hypothetical protein Q4D98_11505 [Planctomycetia bacterium]|nr:hypothetical protein [Planctomycetia bacterium]
MSTTATDNDYLQELTEQHDEVIRQLDELEERINEVLNAYLGKVAELTRDEDQKPLLD